MPHPQTDLPAEHGPVGQLLVALTVAANLATIAATILTIGGGGSTNQNEVRQQIVGVADIPLCRHIRPWRSHCPSIRVGSYEADLALLSAPGRGCPARLTRSRCAAISPSCSRGSRVSP